jgi:hypothetical protein
MRSRHSLSQLLVISIALTIFLPAVALAKRTPAPKVEPVLNRGICYTSHDGADTPRRQCVRASEIKTGKVLWDATVFRTFLCPFVEECRRLVFIERMFIADGSLIVIAENKRAYRVNLNTGAARKIWLLSSRKVTNQARGTN